ncbi:MAG: WG repeat-containing protein, partial [Muribaculaceae bacterium]|nr:WG repeat-containing protein [Muribaculaceae bacterium]
HKGYIELYLLDSQKKAAHDQWLLDMKQYEINLANYKRTKAKHEADVAAYKAKVNAARQEATNRYNAERARVEQAAKAQAQAEQRKRAAQAQNSGWLGALAAGLGAVSDGVNIANAVNSVQFEPFFNKVKAERDLLVEPTAPYNPYPEKPKEPSSGYYWASFSLRQPINYSSIDFEKISDGEGFADVKSVDGKWGLVDATMSEIIPCTNNSKVLNEWFNNAQCKVKTNTGYGILSKDGKWVIPSRYSSIKKLSNKGYIVTSDSKSGILSTTGELKMPLEYQEIQEKEGLLYCKKGDVWGINTLNYEELYPCQFQNVKLIKLNGNSYLLTQLKGQWGALNFNNGKTTLPNQYSHIETVSIGNNKDCFRVKKNNVIGLNREDGSVILPAKFDNIEVKDKLYHVKSGKNVGLFNSTGIEIIPTDKYTAFNTDNIKIGGNEILIFRVSNNGKNGICNIFGTELIPCNYTELNWIEDLNAFRAKNDSGKYGILSLAGDVVVPFCTDASISYSKYAPDFLTYGDNYGAINFNGEEFVKFKGYNKKNHTK